MTRATLAAVAALAVAGLPVAGHDEGAREPGHACAGEALVIAVRHAEVAPDGTDDPDLGEAGGARALLLARRLAEAGITEVWTSELKRSRQTAAPIARAAGVEARVHPAREVESLAHRLRASARGTVVVVGHSNTVPALLAALGVESPPPIAHDEYDHLFLLPVGAGCAGPLVTLRLDGAEAEESE